MSELAASIDTQMAAAVSGAVEDERRQGDQRTETACTLMREETLERTRRFVSDSLNQTIRRLRQAPSHAGVLTLLAEASAPWTEAAAVILIPEGDDGDPSVLATRQLKTAEALPAFSLSEAAALRAVVETTEPIAALATPSELSPALSEAFGPDVKVHLLPVAVRGRVTAILVTAGAPVTGALELMAEAAGMRLEALNPAIPAALKPLPAPGLVQITQQHPAAAEIIPAPAPVQWDDLSPTEQRDHLHAQRIARVRVAELRLYHADALREGVFAGNIYTSLREQIEQARTDFLQQCLSKSPSMVDYLHLEILRSLAHDDERLLGSDYPGPMV